MCCVAAVHYYEATSNSLLIFAWYKIQCHCFPSIPNIQQSQAGKLAGLGFRTCTPSTALWALTRDPGLQWLFSPLHCTWRALSNPVDIIQFFHIQSSVALAQVPIDMLMNFFIMTSGLPLLEKTPSVDYLGCDMWTAWHSRLLSLSPCICYNIINKLTDQDMT